LIRLLEEQGPTLPFPYSSQVRDKLRELRTHAAGEQHRILYFADPRRRLVLRHAFRKHTNRIPAREIQIAVTRMTRWLDRLGKKETQG
jgi:hypothetical protein